MWNGDINNIGEVVVYLNNELAKGRTQKEIEINDFRVNERVIAKRLTSRGYKKIDNQYIKYDNRGAEVIKTKTEERDNNHIKVIEDSKQEYDNSNTLVIKQKEIQNKLIGLAKNYDKILKIIQEYDEQSDEQSDKNNSNISIQLPMENKTDFRATIRVNNVIWDNFSNFANNHKEFTKRDLISMALKEYMENHK